MQITLELSKPTALSDVEAWVNIARKSGATGGSPVTCAYQNVEVTIRERDDSGD